MSPIDSNGLISLPQARYTTRVLLEVSYLQTSEQHAQHTHRAILSSIEESATYLESALNVDGVEPDIQVTYSAKPRKQETPQPAAPEGEGQQEGGSSE